MDLSSDIGNKKTVVAERTLDSGVPDNLCNLFVSYVDKFTVFSIYSALSKKFVAYRVFLDHVPSESYSASSYNAVYRVGVDPDFELVPKGFASQNLKMDGTDFLVESKLHGDEIHVAYGLEKLAEEATEPMAWLFISGDVLSVLVAKDKRLQFANSFKYTDQTECLYFILNALKVTQTAQDETHLVVDYSSSQKFGLIEFLAPYFKTISKLSIPFENPDPEMEELPFLLAQNHLAALCV